MSGIDGETRFVLACNPKPHIIDRIRARGLEVVSAYPGEAPAHASGTSALVIADEPGPDGVIAALSEAGLRDRTVGVLTHSEAALLLADEVARRLGLPGNPDGVVHSTIDKGTMRTLLANDDRFAVAHRIAHGPADVDDMIAACGTVVAKPRDGAGSAGVRTLTAADDTADLPFPLLVEEHLDGPEYSVEALSAAGGHRILGITEKFLFPGTVVESGHLFPGRLNPDEAEAIGAFTADFLDLIGVRLGVTHTEVKLTPKGPRVIETHTRAGGDHIAKLVQLSCGLDPISLSVAAATGDDPAPEPKPSYWATTRYRAFGEGRIARVAGLDVARHMPGVNFVESELAVGRQLRRPRHSLDRPLGVVAIGRDPQEALDNAAHALDQVRVDLE